MVYVCFVGGERTLAFANSENEYPQCIGKRKKEKHYTSQKIAFHRVMKQCGTAFTVVIHCRNHAYCQHETYKEASGVAHENFGWLPVVIQEAEQCSNHCGVHKEPERCVCKVVIVWRFCKFAYKEFGKQEHGAEERQCLCACLSVDTVNQVVGIGNHYHERNG